MGRETTLDADQSVCLRMWLNVWSRSDPASALPCSLAELLQWSGERQSSCFAKGPHNQ